MTLDPGGVTVEKSNILKAGEVLQQIRGSVVLRQVGLLLVEGEFICHNFFTEGDTLPSS
ncbi:UNVERIFIED_CONTAM: hypothetical protein Sradi_3575400 [Sesamum radiatum]|uniref:Uncharacterized protein n=1 Tax=Sesamum radiatum TaxID=300843 RepID=A0AAW2QGE2_SESRA